jgi:hypothetical protein
MKSLREYMIKIGKIGLYELERQAERGKEDNMHYRVKGIRLNENSKISDLKKVVALLFIFLGTTFSICWILAIYLWILSIIWDIPFFHLFGKLTS